MIAIENVFVASSGVKPGRYSIQIEGNRITRLTKDGALDRSDTVIDGSQMIAMPGLINTHTHAAMTLLRSYGDDMPLQEWLEKKIWPLEQHLTPDDIYIGTKLAIVEMLRTGTTTMNDMYFQPLHVAKACVELGMRAFVSSSFFDFGQPDLLEKNIAAAEKDVRDVLDNYGGTIVKPTIGPHAPYTVSLDGLKRAMEVAEKYDVLVHFHLAETEKEIRDFREQHGTGLVEKLDEIGFLNRRLIAAHAVWLSEGDVKILAERGVSVSHNPVSNMKLAVGSAMPYHMMKAAGLNATLGTDGAASNNNLNMLESMKFAALLQKYEWDMQTLLPAEEAFAMATVNGARALGIDAGVIAEGKLADIVLIDRRRPELSPWHNHTADLVYSFNGPVDTVIVDGRIVMDGGHIEGEEDIIEEAAQAAQSLIDRSE